MPKKKTDLVIGRLNKIRRMLEELYFEPMDRDLKLRLAKHLKRSHSGIAYGVRNFWHSVPKSVEQAAAVPLPYFGDREPEYQI